MRFTTAYPPRIRQRDPVLPMVSVVLLLLVFFLMSATVAPVAPFDMSLPKGDIVFDAGGSTALFLAADGSLSYGDARGEAVFGAIAAERSSLPVELRADAGVRASDVAALLARLAEVGIPETRLVLGRP